MSDKPTFQLSNSTDPAPRSRWKKKRFIIPTALIAIFVLLGVIGAANGGTRNSFKQGFDKGAGITSTSAGHTTTTSPTTTAASAVLLDLSGSGTKSTQTFTAPKSWNLVWSYDCSQTGSSGNFQVYVYDSNGNIDISNQGVNQLGASGNDIQSYHNGGQKYLEINSECSWHVTAKS